MIAQPSFSPLKQIPNPNNPYACYRKYTMPTRENNYVLDRYPEESQQKGGRNNSVKAIQDSRPMVQEQMTNMAQYSVKMAPRAECLAKSLQKQFPNIKLEQSILQNGCSSKCPVHGKQHMLQQNHMSLKAQSAVVRQSMSSQLESTNKGIGSSTPKKKGSINYEKMYANTFTPGAPNQNQLIHAGSLLSQSTMANSMFKQKDSIVKVGYANQPVFSQQ